MNSFLNRIRGRKNRTFSWEAIAVLNETLTVDLTTHRFCGVAIGDPIEKLSFLGPADNPYDLTEIYNYYKRGFYLVEDGGKLETVVFLLVPDATMPKLTPFEGRWLVNGRPQPITTQTVPQEIRLALGEPSQVYSEPGGELIWDYQFSGVEWEFAWLENQLLQSVEMREPGAG